MAFMMYSVDEAVDRKFIITKKVSNQAEPGTLIHVMDASEGADGVSVDYRVTGTGQDFSIKFANLKQFCKWSRPDTFIARHYESLNPKDIVNYMKVSNRSFTTFCLPLMLIAIAIIWCIVLLLPLEMVPKIIIGVVLSVVVAFVIFQVYKKQKSNATMKIYSKVSSSKWGLVIK